MGSGRDEGGGGVGGDMSIRCDGRMFYILALMTFMCYTVLDRELQDVTTGGNSVKGKWDLFLLFFTTTCESIII